MIVQNVWSSHKSWGWLRARHCCVVFRINNWKPWRSHPAMGKYRRGHWVNSRIFLFNIIRPALVYGHRSLSCPPDSFRGELICPANVNEFLRRIISIIIKLTHSESKQFSFTLTLTLLVGLCAISGKKVIFRSVEQPYKWSDASNACSVPINRWRSLEW